MAMRAQWNENQVFSECPTCRHLGPHEPDELGILTCAVCGTRFAAGPSAAAATTLSYVDTTPDEALTTSWIPDLPDDGD